MPRETIITSRFPGDDNFNVKVGWNRDMDVQIGISESMDRSMWWVFGEKYLDQIGEDVQKAITAGVPTDDYDFTVKTMDGKLCINETRRDLTNEELGNVILNLLDTTCGSFDSLWSTLSRKDINDLIRVLRRARDSAFGKDE